MRILSHVNRHALSSALYLQVLSAGAFDQSRYQSLHGDAATEDHAAVSAQERRRLDLGATHHAQDEGHGDSSLFESAITTESPRIQSHFTSDGSSINFTTAGNAAATSDLGGNYLDLSLHNQRERYAVFITPTFYY
jgi:hypothetical protein